MSEPKPPKPPKMVSDLNARQLALYEMLSGQVGMPPERALAAVLGGTVPSGAGTSQDEVMRRAIAPWGVWRGGWVAVCGCGEYLETGEADQHDGAREAMLVGWLLPPMELWSRGAHGVGRGAAVCPSCLLGRRTKVGLQRRRVREMRGR